MLRWNLGELGNSELVRGLVGGAMVRDYCARGVASATIALMCAACAMAAAAGASGVRTWLQTHHFPWLTPPRLRAAAIAVFSGAAIVSTVGLPGSPAPPSHAPSAHLAASSHTEQR